MNTKFWTILFFLQFVLLVNWSTGQDTSSSINDKEWDAFPILNYDSDVGIGYGAKVFFYNFIENNESFDLTIYNSTKGERWYRLVFSSFDPQRRHGKKYKTAVDLTIDYDKWINYYFYSEMANNFYFERGIKPNKEYIKELYVREPVSISAILSRGLTADFIMEIGVSYHSISCYSFDSVGVLQFLRPTSTQHITGLFNFRLDTRVNVLNPTKGILILLSNEYAHDLLGEKQSYFKIGLTFQSYLRIYSEKLILATRLNLEATTNESYQNSLALGGNNSIRGLAQDRYLSSSHVLINSELRFPILWRFSGIAGIDVGNNARTPNWLINAVVGLRLNLDNFIVRADIGFGSEATGFYFNFGHLF